MVVMMMITDALIATVAVDVITLHLQQRQLARALRPQPQDIGALVVCCFSNLMVAAAVMMMMMMMTMTMMVMVMLIRIMTNTRHAAS